jgi:metallo-beta-lactamase family protein
MSQLSLTFLGAAGTGTGSKHLLAIGDRRVLVDCGLFQGLKELRLRNGHLFLSVPIWVTTDARCCRIPRLCPSIAAAS